MFIAIQMALRKKNLQKIDLHTIMQKDALDNPKGRTGHTAANWTSLR